MKTLALSLSLMAFGSSALAGNLTPPTEPVVTPPAAYNWAGAYAGAQIGYLDSNIKLTGQNLTSGATMSSSDIDASGVVGGIYGGYNWHPAGNVVYGVEGEFNWSAADKTGNGVPGPGFGFLQGSVKSEVKKTAALRGRIGYAQDRTLFYLAGGIAFADIDLSGTNAAGGGPFGHGETLTGWTLGAGVERAISNQWVVRLDYRYSDFGDESFGFTSGAGTPHRFRVEAQVQEVKVGIAYRF